MKEITSRFNGWCYKCHQNIAAGEKVMWEPGRTEHIACPVVAPVAPAPALRNGFYADESDIDVSGIELGRWGSKFAIPFDGEGAFDGHFFCQIQQGKPGNFYVKWIYGPTERLIGKQMGTFGQHHVQFQTKFADRFDSLINDIVADPAKYKALYGQRVGKCGHCGLRLTDALSRQLGIGPVCRGQLGL